MGSRLRNSGWNRSGLSTTARTMRRGRPASATSRRHRDSPGGAGPPLDAFLDQIADRVHVIAAAAFRGAAALAGLPRGSGQRGLDDLPFRIAHVRGVPRSSRAAADPGRAAAACHRPAGRAHTLGMRGSSSVLDRHKSGSWGTRAHPSGNDTRRNATIRTQPADHKPGFQTGS